jgi:hypothetical protein
MKAKKWSLGGIGVVLVGLLIGGCGRPTPTPPGNQPRTPGPEAVHPVEETTATEEGGIAWEEDLDDAVTQAKEENKIVIVDFSSPG